MIVYLVRDRLVDGYSPRKQPTWRKVMRKGHTWQMMDGERVELFRIKILAEALDRTVAALKDWEKRGLLPPPLFAPENEQCKHWYSAVQIINCHRVMMTKFNGKKYLSDKKLFGDFIAELKKVWYEQEVVIEEKKEQIHV